jgi:type II secretory pathway pseudopilin PulG
MEESEQTKKKITPAEFLVTIIILGILAAIVCVSISEFKQRARDNKRASDVILIALALEKYYDAQSSSQYPQAEKAGGKCVANPCAYALVLTGYFPSLPKDPKSGTDYFYFTKGNPADNYCLSVVLENGRWGNFYTDKDGSGFDNGADKADCNPGT